MAVKYLLAAGLKPKGDVHLNVVVDEEVSGHGTLDTVIRGYRADAGISGETSGLAVQPACIGPIWFEIEIHGKSPATCLLKGSIGTVPGEDHEGVKQSLVQQIARAAAEDPWMKLHPPKVRFVGYDAEASEIPRDPPIVATVCKNYKEITGRDPEISGRQGAADTRFLNRYAATPTVIFGPGSTPALPADDEDGSIEDYLTAIKVMALRICDWCGIEG